MDGISDVHGAVRQIACCEAVQPTDFRVLVMCSLFRALQRHNPTSASVAVLSRWLMPTKTLAALAPNWPGKSGRALQRCAV